MLTALQRRIRRRRIHRFETDEGSVLYDDGTRIWTVNGSRVKHFEWEDLEGRYHVELDDGTLLFLPAPNHSAEPSFLFTFKPNAKVLFVIAADRPRGIVSTALCSSFGVEIKKILRFREKLAEKGVLAHIALVDVFNWNVDETRDGNRFLGVSRARTRVRPFFAQASLRRGSRRRSSGACRRRTGRRSRSWPRPSSSTSTASRGAEFKRRPDAHSKAHPRAGVLVHPHGACARFEGRTAQVVRYVNAVFGELHDLLTASASVV